MDDDLKRAVQISSALELQLEDFLPKEWQACVVSGNFKWNRAEPKDRLWADILVKLGQPLPVHPVPWCTWENGVPDWAFHYLWSEERRSELQRDLKSYYEAGLKEVLVFDPSVRAAESLRTWRRGHDGFIVVSCDPPLRAVSVTLEQTFGVCPDGSVRLMNPIDGNPLPIDEEEWQAFRNATSELHESLNQLEDQVHSIRTELDSKIRPRRGK
jgi:hypothetical protein